MVNNFYASLLFVVLFISNANSHADETLTSSVSIETHVVDIHVEANLSETTIETVHLKANDDTGRVRLSTFPIMFDGTNSDVKVLEAGTIHNGNNTPLDINSIKTVDVPLNLPGTASLKMLQLPFTGVGTGDTIWYKTMKKSKVGTILGSYDVYLTFGYMSVEKEADITITSAVPLYFHSGGKDFFRMIRQTFPTINSSPYVWNFKLVKPVMSVSESDFTNLSPSKIKQKALRIYGSSSKDWSTWAKSAARFYEIAPSELNSKEFKDVLSKIPYDPLDAAKSIENFQLWTSENITYSARWINEKSGWSPRSLKDIITSKVGDCKDFAKLFLAFSKARNLDAQPVLVHLKSGHPSLEIVTEPIFEKNPLPMNLYFNHVVVRYKNGPSWITLDPGRNIADAIRTPYFLDNTWAANIFEGTPMYKIRVGGKDYSLLNIDNTFEILPNRNLHASAKMTASGEIANYLRTVYFSEGESAFKSALKIFVMSNSAKNIETKSVSPISRKNEPIKFELGYTLNANGEDKEKKDQIQYNFMPPYPALVSYRAIENKVSPPDVPGVYVQKSIFPNLFLKDEVKNDCYVKGPIVSVLRSTLNTDEGVTVEDSIDIKSTGGFSDYNEENGRFTEFNRWELRNCVYTDLNFENKNSGPKQLAFESAIDLKSPLARRDESDKSNYYEKKRLREINYRIKSSQANASLWKERSHHIKRLGYLSSGLLYQKEHLLDSKESLLNAHKLNPKDVGVIGQIGITLLQLGEHAEARSYFKLGFGIDNRDVELLVLGGRLFEHDKNYEMAEKYFLSASKQKDPNSFRKHALYDLAKLYCGPLQKCEKSLPLYDQVIAISPNDAWAYYNASLAYNDHKFYSKAEELVRKALKLMEFSAAKSHLANILQAQAYPLIDPPARIATLDEFKKAEDLLSEAYKLDTSNGNTLFSLSLLYQQRSLRTQSVDDLRMGRNYHAELQKNPTPYFLQNGAHLTSYYSKSDQMEKNWKVMQERSKKKDALNAPKEIQGQSPRSPANNK